MKTKFLFLALLGFLTFGTVNAQRMAYVDVSSLLDALPDYKNAQTELDRIAEQWKQDIDKEYKKIDEMYRKFRAEQVLLSDTDKKKREDDIVAAEKTVRDLQKTKFGTEGELFKKRQALIKPIQDRVYKAIENYANEKGYDFIFDKGSAGFLFATDKLDKTQEVLKKL
jgi:outer membrane protein